MKRYCFVIELKPEHVKEYCDIHRNPWPEMLTAISEAGAKELVIWNYKSFSIVYYECEDLDAVYARLGALEVTKRWNVTVGPWLAEAPTLDGTSEVATCVKIFDLRQQLAGRLEQT
jgi:L-rhamnose mutarotase